MQKIITNNSGEVLAIKWDGERFTLVHIPCDSEFGKCIVLSPGEMDAIVEFVEEAGNGS